MNRRAALGGVALGFSAGWNLSNVGAVAEPVASAYGVSLAAVGLFTTALFVTHAGMQVPAGRLIDRLGARRVGLLGFVVIAGCNAAALAAPETELALSMRALSGFGTAFVFVAGSDYVRAAGGSSLAQGLYGAVTLGTGGLALAIVPQIEPALGWRAPFATAAVAALTGAAMLFASPGDPPHVPTPTSRGVFGDRTLVPFGVLHAASFGLSVVIGNWIVTLLTRDGGYSDGAAGAIGALTLALGVLTRPFGGWVRREHPGRVRPLLVAGLLTGSGGTLLVATAGPLAVVLLGATLVGLAAGVPFAISFAGAAETRRDAPGAAVGAVNFTAAATILVATPLVGAAFSLPSDGRIGFVCVAALWAGAVAAVPPATRAARRGSGTP